MRQNFPLTIASVRKLSMCDTHTEQGIWTGFYLYFNNGHFKMSSIFMIFIRIICVMAWPEQCNMSLSFITLLTYRRTQCFGIVMVKHILLHFRAMIFVCWMLINVHDFYLIVIKMSYSYMNNIKGSESYENGPFHVLLSVNSCISNVFESTDGTSFTTEAL
jgi:hypothetical protein